MPVLLSPPTLTERIQIKAAFHQGDLESVTVWGNEDGTFAAEVAGVIFEEENPANLFRTLASICGGDS